MCGSSYYQLPPFLILVCTKSCTNFLGARAESLAPRDFESSCRHFAGTCTKSQGTALRCKPPLLERVSSVRSPQHSAPRRTDQQN